jgi:hypothetical protein
MLLLRKTGDKDGCDRQYPGGLRQRGRESGSRPEASVAADAVAAFEYSHLSVDLSSEVQRTQEVRMNESDQIRVTEHRFGFVVTVKQIACVAATVFLALGYGNWYPSA